MKKTTIALSALLLASPVFAATTHATEGKSDSVGSQVSEGAQKTWHKTKEGTEKGWDATKEGAQKGWNKTKDASQKGWDATKEGAQKGWDKTKDGAAELEKKVSE